MASKDDFTELGSSGLGKTSGFVIDEFISELRGIRGARVYREMSDNDPVVGAMVYAIEKLILAIKWDVAPYQDGDEPVKKKDQKNADFLEECMYDMSESWSAMISQILSFLVYGYAFCEIVYKKRVSPDAKSGEKRSKYTDGKIGWRKIALRGQETLWDWVFDDNGGVRAFQQQDPYANKGLVTIPIEKGLLFRTANPRNNPEGRSILRNAYRPWKFKKTIEEIEAVGIERDLAGLPVAYVPPSMLSSAATTAEVSARNAMQDLIRRIKRNENEGVLFPLAYDEQGRELYKLTLLNSGGTRQFNTDAVVQRYDQRIAMTVLADFILLGHDKVGSFSLGASKIDLFTSAIQQIADTIADTFNDHAIPRLFKLNGLDTTRLPEIKAGEITHVDLGVLGDFVSKMTAAGAMQPDTAMDNYLRGLANLPPRSEEEGGMMAPQGMDPLMGGQPPAGAPPAGAPPAGAPPASPAGAPPADATASSPNFFEMAVQQEQQKGG
jgi:hypothetical protein